MAVQRELGLPPERSAQPITIVIVLALTGWV